MLRARDHRSTYLGALPHHRDRRAMTAPRARTRLRPRAATTRKKANCCAKRKSSRRLEFRCTGSPEDRVLRDPSADPSRRRQWPRARRRSSAGERSVGALRRENDQPVARQVGRRRLATASLARGELAPRKSGNGQRNGRQECCGQGRGHDPPCVARRQRQPAPAAGSSRRSTRRIPSPSTSRRSSCLPAVALPCRRYRARSAVMYVWRRVRLAWNDPSQLPVRVDFPPAVGDARCRSA